MTHKDQPHRPERFYKTVSLATNDTSLALLLDGRAAKTRSGIALSTPVKLLAEAIADEWDCQRTHINFATMPMTGYLTTLIDATEADRTAWRNEVLSFLASDLLCYRAESPEGLIKRQAQTWDPLLARLAQQTDIQLLTATGIVHVTQPPQSLVRAQALLTELADAKLLCTRRITELTGSAVLGLLAQALLINADQIIAAAQLDENFQAEKWGIDAQAAQRRAAIAGEIRDALRFIEMHV